ncbi:MAG: hypothetical protein H0U74_20475 [Bradymonadaceae bacterium]|nr:hypothetical protein [Lujinxingiaceae bacterium]
MSDPGYLGHKPPPLPAGVAQKKSAIADADSLEELSSELLADDPDQDEAQAHDLAPTRAEEFTIPELAARPAQAPFREPVASARPLPSAALRPSRTRVYPSLGRPMLPAHVMIKMALVLGGFVVLGGVFFVASGAKDEAPAPVELAAAVVEEPAVVEPLAAVVTSSEVSTLTTVASETVFLAVRNGGWRTSTEPLRLELSDGTRQLHARLIRRQSVIDMTLWEFGDREDVDRAVARIHPPAKSAVFGTTVVKFAPSENENVSRVGMREMGELLKTFQVMVDKPSAK